MRVRKAVSLRVRLCLCVSNDDQSSHRGERNEGFSRSPLSSPALLKARGSHHERRKESWPSRIAVVSCFRNTASLVYSGSLR